MKLQNQQESRVVGLLHKRLQNQGDVPDRKFKSFSLPAQAFSHQCSVVDPDPIGSGSEVKCNDEFSK
jgi:hypothetical protein